MKKPTDRALAEKYGISVQTLGNYKKGDKGKQEIYKALKHWYDMPDYLGKSLLDMNKAELHKLHEYLTDSIQNDADTLQCVCDRLRDM